MKIPTTFLNAVALRNMNGESERGLVYLCKMHCLGSDDENLNPGTLECGFQACANFDFERFEGSFSVGYVKKETKKLGIRCLKAKVWPVGSDYMWERYSLYC